jgi:hypothetical protein
MVRRRIRTILMPNNFARPPRREFSDYLVYVDESGDHSLEFINPQFPVFVLAFCIFQKEAYVSEVCPALQRLKFRYFGHDAVVLHENEIHNARSHFAFLRVPAMRAAFMADLDGFVRSVPFTLIAIAIDKEQHLAQYAQPVHPYHLAMELGLERVCSFLADSGEGQKVTPVIFEARGKKENDALELEFRRVTGGSNGRCMTAQLDILFASKESNACGHQIADLVARPIGRHV